MRPEYFSPPLADVQRVIEVESGFCALCEGVEQIHCEIHFWANRLENIVFFLEKGGQNHQSVLIQANLSEVEYFLKYKARSKVFQEAD